MNKVLIPALLLTAMFCNAQQKKVIIYFPFNKDAATTASENKLREWIATNKDVTVNLLEGYADKTGNEFYNVDLSERRIKYVQSLLEDSGLNLTEVKKEPYGESKANAGHSAPDRKVTLYYTEPVVVTETPSVPQKEPTDFTKKVTKANKGDKIRIPSLNFYNNSDIVLPASSAILQELLTIMQDNPKIKIDIQGHICCQKYEENEISLKRALAVYNFLLKKGISADRLSYKSFGSKKPIYPLPEKNENERVANRRVEIEILSNE
nr:OmpA family protein [uncultured Flavobacterium sp.]